MHEILARLCLRCLRIIRRDTCRGTKKLIGKIRTTNAFWRQSLAHLHASCGEFRNSIFECYITSHKFLTFSLPHFLTSTFSHFHIFSLPHFLILIFSHSHITFRPRPRHRKRLVRASPVPLALQLHNYPLHIVPYFQSLQQRKTRPVLIFEKFPRQPTMRLR